MTVAAGVVQRPKCPEGQTAVAGKGCVPIAKQCPPPMISGATPGGAAGSAGGSSVGSSVGGDADFGETPGLAEEVELALARVLGRGKPARIG